MNFDEPRTIHGSRRVSARLGWVGEKSDLFSILRGGTTRNSTFQFWLTR
jgi:hypothetical protein